MSDARPLPELIDSGLLWLINRVAFHPRGFALVLVTDDDTSQVVGWRVLGTGSEAWSYPRDTDQDRFLAAEMTLREVSLRVP